MLNFYIQKTNLSKNNLELDSDYFYNLPKKLPGRQPEFYIFNTIDFIITDKTISILRENSNKAKNFISLSNDISFVISKNKEAKQKINKKYNKEDFISLFKDFIIYSNYPFLTDIEIENRIILEYFLVKEEFKISYSKNADLKKRISSNLRTDYSFSIFTDLELSELEKLKDTSYTIYDFKSVIEEIIPDKRFNLVKINAYNYSNKYDPNWKINLPENEMSFSNSNLFPFNHIDSQSKFSYPLLANSLTLAFSHRAITDNTTYQQVELSTNAEHSAFYYRKARHVYIVNPEYLKNDYLNNFELSFFDLINLKKLLGKAAVYFNLNKDDFDDYSKIKEVLIKISQLQRLFCKTKNDLLFEIEKLDLFINEITDNIIIKKDLDIFGNPIPLYYINDNRITFIYETEKLPNYLETNFIVAKEMKNSDGSLKAIDIETVKKIGIESVLNNDFDFPIKAGIYDINTPNIIYFPPVKNNTVSKPIICYDGNSYYNFLKRIRVLYLPDYIFERIKESEKIDSYYNKVVVDKDDFVLPYGRELSGLPCLVYSYLLTPMTDYDKLIYFEKYEKRS